MCMIMIEEQRSILQPISLKEKNYNKKLIDYQEEGRKNVGAKLSLFKTQRIQNIFLQC